MMHLLRKAIPRSSVKLPDAQTLSVVKLLSQGVLRSPTACT